jgi:hypothetical protein
MDGNLKIQMLLIVILWDFRFFDWGGFENEKWLAIHWHHFSFAADNLIY